MSSSKQSTVFASKAEARDWVWSILKARRVSRFPFPIEGRIPNFKGAEAAAQKLFEISAFQKARRLKINPDSPQRPVREMALKRGICVYMPTPRLRAGFIVLDPHRIPEPAYAEAARLSKADRWAVSVPLHRLPPLDAIVTGSVAVTRQGFRCGKGEGYGDLEYAWLRELGHPPVPVATTVHPLQIVDFFPPDPTDLPLNWIVTPEACYRVEAPPPPPTGIVWEWLREEDLQAMPVLQELKQLKTVPEDFRAGKTEQRR